MDRSEINGHCGPRDLFEEDLTQYDLRTPRWSSREESRASLSKGGPVHGHESRARGCWMEPNGGLPRKPRRQKSAKLIVEPMGRAPRPTDGRQPQLASQIVRRCAEMDLAVLCSDRFGRQPRQEEAGIGAVRQSDASRRAHPQRMAAIDSLESVALRPAMGECREYQNARAYSA